MSVDNGLYPAKKNPVLFILREKLIVGKKKMFSLLCNFFIL